jgi:hypothetical protein
MLIYFEGHHLLRDVLGFLAGFRAGYSTPQVLRVVLQKLQFNRELWVCLVWLSTLFVLAIAILINLLLCDFQNAC